MILQAGNRTDIPAFYAEWFCSRLREGEVLVRNPYNRLQVTRYRTDPSVVDLIVFCTKNPEPMLAHWEELKKRRTFWYVTITPYGREIEPNVPEAGRVIESFQRLSSLVGKERICWRYDPILLWGPYTKEAHLEHFARMAAALEGKTDSCVISFVDIYGKTLQNFPELAPVPFGDRLFLGEHMQRIAAEHGMVLRPCGEGTLLQRFGADCGGCMTIPLMERAAGERFVLPKGELQRGRTRQACACYITCDIGQYNTCAHFCRYCYANQDRQTVEANRKNHDPASPFLIGHAGPQDIVRDAKQESWIDRQLTLDLF